ncbi:MAG: IPExxxVDY family protein [Flavobacteriales bacterium]|nr:IPExxxVDY family protein [Bacteroidota bacterium]MCB9240181.1 IPExxxVDY family protein [Flavobacteriales bacterium]
MKKYILEDLSGLNCRVFGLVSTHPFYQVVWDLKRVTNMTFEREEDVEWTTRNEVCYAPIYRFHDLATDSVYEIVRNHATQGLLAPEMKSVDAFLIETNYAGNFSITTNSLRQSKFVQYCFSIELSTLKTESQMRLRLN